MHATAHCKIEPHHTQQQQLSVHTHPNRTAVTFTKGFIKRVCLWCTQRTRSTNTHLDGDYYLLWPNNVKTFLRAKTIIN